ncbi:MAG TPA: cupin domain-containing protein, partial [Polyangia bacterium]|nr:cupin domain-containing protein [Polyangia bacterium]
APSLGSAETCVWQITLAPATPGTPHSVDREEIFVGVSGQAHVELDGADTQIDPGDALVVPAGRTFSLSNPGAVPFVALAVAPVGAQAVLPDGVSFSPPWTL